MSGDVFGMCWRCLLLFVTSLGWFTFQAFRHLSITFISFWCNVVGVGVHPKVAQTDVYTNFKRENSNTFPKQHPQHLKNITHNIKKKHHPKTAQTHHRIYKKTSAKHSKNITHSIPKTSPTTCQKHRPTHPKHITNNNKHLQHIPKTSPDISNKHHPTHPRNIPNTSQKHYIFFGK